MEIVKQSELKAASFVGNNNIPLAVKMVIKLLRSATEEGKIITRDDILNLYADWRFTGIEFIPTYKYDFKEDRHVLVNQTKQMFLSKWNIKSKAVQWFKSNLGSAILKGKILAIPVIDIE